jgi:hypothetical protein
MAINPEIQCTGVGTLPMRETIFEHLEAALPVLSVQLCWYAECVIRPCVICARTGRMRLVSAANSSQDETSVPQDETSVPLVHTQQEPTDRFGKGFVSQDGHRSLASVSCRSSRRSDLLGS